MIRLMAVATPTFIKVIGQTVQQASARRAANAAAEPRAFRFLKNLVSTLKAIMSSFAAFAGVSKLKAKTRKNQDFFVEVVLVPIGRLLLSDQVLRILLPDSLYHAIVENYLSVSARDHTVSKHDFFHRG